MKKLLAQGTVICCLLALAVPAWSLAITDVGSIDSMLASTKLSSSGDTGERTWSEGVLGLDLTLTFKYDTTGSGWSPVEGYDAGTKVPEPGTMILLGSGLLGLAAWGRKTNRP